MKLWVVVSQLLKEENNLVNLRTNILMSVLKIKPYLVCMLSGLSSLYFVTILQSRHLIDIQCHIIVLAVLNSKVKICLVY